MRELDDVKHDFEFHLRRGNKTWEGSRMMLPEHVAAIRAQDEREKRVEKHELDPDELQEIGYTVMDALQHTHSVVINYWHNWTYQDVIGVIADVSKDNKRIKLELDDGEFEYLEVEHLRSVQII